MNPILSRWNSLPAAQAAEEILPCAGSQPWANSMAAARPFEDTVALFAAADRIWQELGEPEWLEAFCSHPRIGERKPAQGQDTAQQQQWSAQEQAKAAQSSAEIKAALAEANREYEKKFGRIFLVCATGKSSEEILQNLRKRLQNDDATELDESAEEQRQIIQIRLRKWLNE
jgi:2-oxo-4-hydroxy-4-carboxy-5-ureidoimidazoline decarboxylase